MKSRRILILCVLSLSGSLAPAQTLDSALTYFPLMVGNHWRYADYDYAYGPPGIFLGYSDLSTTGDTLMPNGKQYTICRSAGYNIGGLLGPITYFR